MTIDQEVKLLRECVGLIVECLGGLDSRGGFVFPKPDPFGRLQEIAAELKRDAEEAKGCEKWPNGPMKPEEDDPRVLALSPLARELHDRCTSVMHPNEWERVAAVMKEMFDVACKAVADRWAASQPPTPPADDELEADLRNIVCSPGGGWSERLAAHVRKMIDAAVQAEHDAGLKMIAAIRAQHALGLRSARRELLFDLQHELRALGLRGAASDRCVDRHIAALDAEGKS